MKIARFTKRIVAWIIDEIIPFAGAITFFVFATRFNFFPTGVAYKILIMFLIAYGLVVLISYPVLNFSNLLTLGGAIMGIRVSHVDGGKIKFREALLKSILVGVIAFALVNAIYMLIVRTERSVFDRLTDTYVAEYRHAFD